MGKELETIEQVTSCGELHNKLVEAEEAKAEIEAILLKRVSFIFRSAEKHAAMYAERHACKMKTISGVSFIRNPINYSHNYDTVVKFQSLFVDTKKSLYTNKPFLFSAVIYVQNTLLQETYEEWEQCERKLKDIRVWIDKVTNNLESIQFKKKPLRDQHGLCEKYLAEINGQKTKITLSIEKLQVNFSASFCLFQLDSNE